MRRQLIASTSPVDSPTRAARPRRWARTWVPLAALAAAGLLAAPAGAAPGLDTHPHFEDFVVLHGPSAGRVVQVGEVVVMEGDDEIVTALGGGDFGIDISAQMPLIGQRLYMNYPDEFDGIAVFTSFPDLLQGGAAYSISAGWSGASGLGTGTGSNAAAFGSGGRLISVINMNDTGQYGSMEADDNFFASVFGQEFGHTWLSFMSFIDPTTGVMSSDLLGRDGSHWSAIFDSGASVMDGVSFTDNGDGTFTTGQTFAQYGPLDLYAMGVIAPEEVGPMFVIRNARYADNGQLVNPITDSINSEVHEGRVLTGTRLDFGIEDVIAAIGPRVPAWDEENEDFRVAFILVTRPGETADDVADRTEKLNIGRITWENKHTEWALNRSTMCTDVTAQCPLAIAEVDAIAVSEAADDADGDGVIEPGEKIQVDVTFDNYGTEAATDATATLTSESPGLIVPETPETLPEIGVQSTLEHSFFVEIDNTACGEEVELAVTSQIAHRTWKNTAAFRPGLIDDGVVERFASDAGWQANPDGLDITISGGWEHGVPAATFFAGRLLQPNGCVDGETDSCWFTSLSDDFDDGELVGKSRLVSAPIDMSQLFAPIVRYTMWYLALDRTPTSLTTSPEAHLLVEASSDGGVTWVEIDRVQSDPVRWITREAALTGVEPTDSVLLRFTADDPLNPEDRLVEIGIDDVQILSLSTSCDPAGDVGGCCQASPDRGALGGTAALALAVLLLLARRRRA